MELFRNKRNFGENNGNLQLNVVTPCKFRGAFMAGMAAGFLEFQRWLKILCGGALAHL